MYKFNSVFHYY